MTVVITNNNNNTLIHRGNAKVGLFILKRPQPQGKLLEARILTGLSNLFNLFIIRFLI